jgi:hypothetical protein
MLGKNEQSVRQMTLRARHRVQEERPRFAVDRRAAAVVAERFITALRDADIDEMRAVLAEDVIQVADGGGNVSAALRPIVGRDKVIRLFEGVRTKFWSELEFRLATVNAQPGILMLRPDGSAYGAVALDFEDGRICALYAVLNPEKLTRANQR